MALLLHRTNPARAPKTHNRSLSPSYPPRCLQKHGSAPPAPSRTTWATTPRSAACVRQPVRALTSAPRLPLPLLPRRHQLLLSRPLLPLHPSPRSLPLSAASLHQHQINVGRGSTCLRKRCQRALVILVRCALPHDQDVAPVGSKAQLRQCLCIGRNRVEIIGNA